MPDINAQFTLTGDDYEAYLRYFYGHTRTGRRHMRRLYAMGVALFLLYVGMEYDHPKFGVAHPAYFAANMLISVALLGGAYWFCITRLWPSIAQATVLMSAQKSMFVETAIVLEDTGLSVRTPAGEGRLAWEHVVEAGEDEGYMYLFTGGINAFIIPKRAFVDDRGAGEAMDIIRRHTG